MAGTPDLVVQVAVSVAPFAVGWLLMAPCLKSFRQPLPALSTCMVLLAQQRASTYADHLAGGHPQKAVGTHLLESVGMAPQLR